MKFLVFLSSSIALIYGQQCGREFEGFRDCMEKEEGIPPPQPQPYPGGSVSANITNCFTSSGCKVPELVGAEAAGSEVLMDALVKCSDEVKNGIKPLIEQCMVSTPNVGPGFVLHNDLIAPLPLTAPTPPPAPPAIVVLHSVTHVFNDHICPTDTEKSAVKSCIIGVADKYMPQPPAKSPIEATFELNQHCYSQELCKTKMTDVCRQDIENMRAYLCNCAKQVFATAASVKPLTQTFNSCVTGRVGAAALQSQSLITFNTYAQRLLTNLMCLEAPDPCKPQEPEPQPQERQQPQFQT